MTIPQTVQFIDDKIFILDQTKLPFKEEFIITDDYERASEAIEKLEIRGAPAIGVVAAYALALSIKNKNGYTDILFNNAYKRLQSTRPTAVNLFYGLDEIKKVYNQHKNDNNLYKILIERAKEIHEEDIKMCSEIARNGLRLFKRRCNVLTHCNAGALATGGNGTAINVIRYAYENDLVNFVHVDETRPLLQGSRLTAWELSNYGIPFSINSDSTAATLMREGKVDIVIVGADRIAVNGDTANKIGTYNLAVLCRYHSIPFYVAAPKSTIDKECYEGNNINIELRDKNELTHLGDVRITSDEYDAYCPAFDVTPNNLITAIVTEKTVYKPPYNFKDV